MSQAVQVMGGNESRDLVPYSTEMEQQADVSLGKTTRYGLIAVAVLVLGFGGLMAFLPMAGAVIANGEVSVETQVKQIAHPFGGVAADILVRDGDRVEEGDVLIRLDDTVSGATAEYSGLSLDQLLARAARLRALRDNAATVNFPAELRDRAATDPVVAGIMQDEARGFQLERQARTDQVRQLEARIAQTEATISSAQSQVQAFGRQEELIEEELVQTRELYEDQLSTLDRVNALERAAVGLSAERDSAAARIIESRARINELRTQMAGLQSDARSQAALELAEVQQLLTDSRTREVTASDTSVRTAIRAPQDGIVNKLTVTTIGGVVPPGETLLELVPVNDELVISARVEVTDIDQVAIDQPAFMRFTALSMRTTPELQGIVTQVDADRRIDQVTGLPYYNARIDIPEEELAKLGAARLSVGMPVEVFIQTGQRTILNYILRPLTDQLNRALRE